MQATKPTEYLRDVRRRLSRLASTTLLLAASASIGASAGCSHSAGSFGKLGFAHGEFPYAVHYADPAGKTLISDHWRLDNFYPDENTGALSPKRGTNYEFELSVDTNGDGRRNLTRQKFVYDLRLEHRVNDATIWTRTMIVSGTDRDKSLKVILRDYVDSISRSGYARASAGGLVVVVVRERRFATEILETEEFELGEQRRALLATLNVADLDQVELSPSDRVRRVTLLFVKTGWNWRYWRPIDDSSVEAVDFPVILLVGYASHPDDYATQLPDYAQLIAQIELFEQQASPYEGTALPPEGKPGTGQPIILPESRVLGGLAGSAQREEP